MRTTDESGVPESGDWSAQPAQVCREGGRVRLGARGVRMAARSRPGLQPSAIERIINHALSHRTVAPGGGRAAAGLPLTHGTGTPSPLTRSWNRPAPRGDGLDARTLHIIEWFTCGTVSTRYRLVRSCQFAVVSQC